MTRYLADLRSRRAEVEALPAKLPDLSVAQRGDIFLLEEFIENPHLPIAEFPHGTGLECSANKIEMDAFVHPRIASRCPLLLLTTGLFIAQEVARELSRFEARFNIIVSYDGESCVVRFHKIRTGERWLSDDLEGYEDEGVLVAEAGSGVAGLKLLAS